MRARTTGLAVGGRAGSVSRRGRLSRSADFDRVFRNGRSQASRELVLYMFPRGDEDGAPRLGLSVSRKVGSAVERNRVCRPPGSGSVRLYGPVRGRRGSPIRGVQMSAGSKLTIGRNGLH